MNNRKDRRRDDRPPSPPLYVVASRKSNHKMQWLVQLVELVVLQEGVTLDP